MTTSPIPPLVERLKAGEDVWDELYPHLVNVLTYAAKRRGMGQQDAEDAAQDTIVWYAAHVDRIEAHAVPSYLARRAHWRAGDQMRHTERMFVDPGIAAALHRNAVQSEGNDTEGLDTDFSLADGDPDPADRVADRDLAQRALDRLPPRVRETVLWMMRGLSQRQAGDKLGVSKGTISNNIYVARMRLLEEGFGEYV